MSRNSLKGHQAERDVHKKETSETVNKLTKTEVDVVRVAEQVGAIQSKLSDVNDMIRAERNRILDTGQKAGTDDASRVESAEQKAADQRQSVEGVDRETTKERQKADAIKPSDSRIRDGGTLAKFLDQTSSQLKEIATDLRTTESGAREKRTRSQSRMADTIRKNRN
jgi:hypothetical protein